MPVDFSRHAAARTSGLTAALAALALGLAACGGGGGDGPGGGNPGGSGQPASMDALLGDWLQKGCVSAGAQSYKRLLRAQRTSDNSIDYYEGVITYGGAECTGAGQQVGPSKLGTVGFSRSEGNGDLSAYWGEYVTVINFRSGAIWTVRSNNLLCLLGDEIPSIQPSLSDVASSLATVPQSSCFTR